MRKRLISLIAMLMVMLAVLCSCGTGSRMPFNGKVEFHGIEITIPDSYVRDSTQSNDDMWVFEQGNYSKYIIMSCKTAEDGSDHIVSYSSFIVNMGGTVEYVEFMGHNGMCAVYEKDNETCYETLFVIDDEVYSIALRGGDEVEYMELMDTVKIPSFRMTKTYSYDKAYYALISKDEDMAVITIYTSDGDIVNSFKPCRNADFWGICWENDSYDIWVQSGDIGVVCYSFNDGIWNLDESAVRPDYIVSKYDK